jgi:hypothetical protein
VGRAGDIDGDGIPDFVVGDPAGWDASGLPMAWILSGKNGSVLRRVALPSHQWSIRLDGGSDLDGDGVPDLLIGGQPSHLEPGTIEIVSGRTGATLQYFSIPGSGRGDSDWVRFVADFDRDGVPDVGVLEPSGAGGSALVVYSGASGTKIGALAVDRACGDLGAFLELGTVGYGCERMCAVMRAGHGGCRQSLRLCSSACSEPLWESFAPTDSECAHSVVASLGDVNGDGIPDLVVSLSERVYVISGKTGDPLMDFPPGSDEFGVSLASLGDIDGDGVPDFVIADANDGMFEGSLVAKSGKTGQDLWFAKLPIEENPYHIGYQLAAIGDVNGDKVTDLIVGSRAREGGAPGLAVLVSGKDGSVIMLCRRQGDDVVVSNQVHGTPRPR